MIMSHWNVKTADFYPKEEEEEDEITFFKGKRNFIYLLHVYLWLPVLMLILQLKIVLTRDTFVLVFGFQGA